MYNEQYLENLLQKYQAMIEHVTDDLLSKKQDFSDSGVQAEYRLVCLQTNTYLNLLQSLYGGLDSETEVDPEDDPDSELDLD